MDAVSTQEVGVFRGLPRDVRIQAAIKITKPVHRFGFGLRGAGRYESKYDLAFCPAERRVSLADQSLAPVALEGDRFTVEIIQKNDIIDVCVNNDQCLINRLHQLTGDSLFLFAENGAVMFEDVRIAPLV
ncbi:MAG: hypothetical protein ABIF71_03475 [Planctomycetota bacterium]